MTAQGADWNDIPALHWQGSTLDCAACEHAAFRDAGAPKPHHV
jgi:LRV protein FeS4 cluster